MNLLLKKQNLEDNLVNIILFGPPGSGKGTQADKLVETLNLYKISTGDLLRKEINKKTILGNKIKLLIEKGNFVSDDIINDLIANIISEKTLSNHLVFDGYPRNIQQAKNLDKMLIEHKQKILCVLCLKVEKDVILKRILGRQVCSKCGMVFNKFFNPHNKNNHECESHYIKTRADDTESTIEKRLNTYTKVTFPLINYYQKQDLVKEIDGNGQIDQIHKEISNIIKSLGT